MENPFRFSGIVDGPAFCNREKEQKELRRYIESSQNVLLYSHRRYGKSSLILKVFKSLKTVTPVYIDLYGTTNAEEFIASFLKGASAIEPKMNRLMKMVHERIRSIGVNFSIDAATGMPTAMPVFKQSVDDRTIEEIFGLVEDYSQKKKMVVAFDEFQEVASYGGDPFEKLLRKSIQQHERISYIFAGSQKHLITEMFNHRKRAFYMLATSYPLGKIKTADYIEWIGALYRSGKRNIEDKFIVEVLELCENHPMYVQEFFFNLWEEPDVTFEVVDRVEQGIVEKRIAQFAYAWDSLTLNQRRASKLIAGTDGKNIFSSENLSRYGFRTASQVTAALSSLQKGGFLDKNEEWKIHDPFFKRWLKRNGVQ